MRELSVTAGTSASPEEVLKAASDFSERRADIWPNVSTKHLQVHQTGDASADVTEGLFNSFFWERCRYDWSRPGSVKATVLESNILQPGSTWELKATECPDETQVESIFVRDYKRGPRARLAEMAFRFGGKQFAGSDLKRALSKIEQGTPEP